jgi:hypothetical protein
MVPERRARGISLAAVALPIGIAYAELAGFPAVAGIYASILPASPTLFSAPPTAGRESRCSRLRHRCCDGGSAGCKRPLPICGCGSHPDVRHRPALYRRRFSWTGGYRRLLVAADPDGLSQRDCTQYHRGAAGDSDGSGRFPKAGSSARLWKLFPVWETLIISRLPLDSVSSCSSASSSTSGLGFLVR